MNCILLLLLVAHCSGFANKTQIIQKTILPRVWKPKMCEECVNYKEIVLNSDVYIDKSLIIKEIMLHSSRLFLFTLPRRWGKSVNLRMIQNFFQIEVDNHGEPFHWFATWAYSAFRKGKIRNLRGAEWFLTKTPMVADDFEFLDEHMSAWPIIYLKMALVDKEIRNNCHNIISGLIFLVRQEYGAHSYVTEKMHAIIEDKKTSKENKTEMRRILNKFKDIRFSKVTMTQSEMKETVYFLSEVLHSHFDQKVIIMIDDYEKLWETIFTDPSFLDEEKIKFFNFYSDFLKKTFIGNEHLEFGIVMGLFRPPKEYYPNLFDNFLECNVITERFMEYFAINQFHMPYLYNLFKVNVFRQERLDKWYDGFKFKNGSLRIYNSGSMVDFFTHESSFDHEKIIKYVPQTWPIKDIIMHNMELKPFKAKAFKLINGDTVIVRGDLYNYTWDQLQQMCTKSWPIYEEFDIEKFTDMALMQLYMLGFLTLESKVDNSELIKLKVPNTETIVVFKEDVEDFYHDRMRFHLVTREWEKNREFCRKFIKREVVHFLEANTTNCSLVREGYEFYLQEEYSFFQNLTTNNSETDDLLHDLLTYSMKDIQCVRREMNLPNKNSKAPNILLILEDRAVSFRMKHLYSTCEQVLQEVKEGTNLSHVEPVKTIQYVALNVLKTPEVEMCSEFGRIT